MFKIAIQKKGRLTEGSLKYLASKGVGVSSEGLRASCGDFEVLFLRQKDIPTVVEQGVVDFGIVGENIICEKKYKVDVLERLGFGKCSLVIAAPSVSDLNGERIATSFPNMLKEFLKKKGTNAAVIEIQGSVEAAPAMGLSDAVCDLVQTGNTLKENNLIPIETVMESEAVLIFNPNSKWPF